MRPWKWFKKERALHRADRLIRKGKSEDAVQLLVGLLVDFPQDLNVHLQLAWAYLEARKPDLALVQAEKGLALSSENGVLFLIQGEAFLALKRHEEARQALHRALELSGDNLRIEYNLGLAYVAAGDLDRASEFFDSIVRYDKSLVQSRLLTMAEHYLFHNKTR